MDEKIAWERFASTGNISDYLLYRKTLEEGTSSLWEDTSYADKNKRFGNFGKDSKRKQ